MKTIQASELRIGNYVHADVGLPSLMLHEIKANDIPAIHRNEVQCYGVPLTEERLIRAGFNTNNNKTFSVSFYDISKKYDSDYFVFEFECYMIDMPNIEIKYVHQLQNFHFALTQTELTFKD